MDQSSTYIIRFGGPPNNPCITFEDDWTKYEVRPPYEVLLDDWTSTAKVIRAIRTRVIGVS